MAWTDPDSWATRLVSGDPWIILIAFITTLALPVLLHLYFYTTSRRIELTPTFLLLGPSGSGKTSLLTLVGSLDAWILYLLKENSSNNGRPAQNRPNLQRPEYRKCHPRRSCFCQPPCHSVRTSTDRRTILLYKMPRSTALLTT